MHYIKQILHFYNRKLSYIHGTLLLYVLGINLNESNIKMLQKSN